MSNLTNCTKIVFRFVRYGENAENLLYSLTYRLFRGIIVLRETPNAFGEFKEGSVVKKINAVGVIHSIFTVIEFAAVFLMAAMIITFGLIK